MVDEVAVRKEILRAIVSDRVRAHKNLFGKRHPVKTPEMHEIIIGDLHSDKPRVVIESFRGSAKSTLSEEAMLIRGGLCEFSYGIILGNTYSRAAQRLASIKREIDQNPYLLTAFGDLKGSIWNEGKIELSNGAIIEAFGARQSMRGAKERMRPDFVLIDDLEDQDWIKSEESIQENLEWFTSEFLPALQDPLRTPIRMLGTPLADNCLLRRLARTNEWVHRVFPIRHMDEHGDMVASWPERFSLEDIERLESSHIAIGQHRTFMQEYMCETESKVERAFEPGMFVYDPTRVRTYQAVYGMIDPARTTNRGSATTGWAVWSWAPGGRLVVWEAGGEFYKPDQIVDLAFRLNERYRPVAIGFEQDGLNEWALQPFRVEQVRRGPLPLLPMKAPRGKVDFIKGLQTFAAARSLIFAGEPGAFSVLTAQMLSFPRGRIDAPNALAFAQLMRPGEAVYPDFSTSCIFEDDGEVDRRGMWLAMNADGARTTGALVQETNGVLRVLYDWVRDGPPADGVDEILRSAVAIGGRETNVVVPPLHFDKFRGTTGLVQSVMRVRGKAPTTGAALELGKVDLKTRMRTMVRGAPALQVSSVAHVVLNGLTAGYAHTVLSGNAVATEPTPGVYRTMIEGLESFAGMASWVQSEEDEGNFRYSRDGRRYRSTMAR